MRKKTKEISAYRMEEIANVKLETSGLNCQFEDCACSIQTSHEESLPGQIHVENTDGMYRNKTLDQPAKVPYV